MYAMESTKSSSLLGEDPLEKSKAPPVRQFAILSEIFIGAPKRANRGQKMPSAERHRFRSYGRPQQGPSCASYVGLAHKALPDEESRYSDTRKTGNIVWG